MKAEKEAAAAAPPAAALSNKEQLKALNKAMSELQRQMLDGSASDEVRARLEAEADALDDQMVVLEKAEKQRLKAEKEAAAAAAPPPAAPPPPAAAPPPQTSKQKLKAINAEFSKLQRQIMGLADGGPEKAALEKQAEELEEQMTVLERQAVLEKAGVLKPAQAPAQAPVPVQASVPGEQPTKRCQTALAHSSNCSLLFFIARSTTAAVD